MKTTYKAIISLMLVLFIDGMGQGIIFPILTATITYPHSTILLDHASIHERDIWYGILVASYYFMWFISAPILGDWSDQVGRKKSLLLCLSVASGSFLLSAFSFDIRSIWLLLIARGLGGLTSGDQAIAKAAVIDLCDPKHKSVYLGLVLFSVSFGLVIGPVIGAVLQNSHLISWFNINTPFYFAATLSILNIIFLLLTFKETNPGKKMTKFKLSKALYLFYEALNEKSIRYLLLTYIFTQIGWSMFYIITPSYLTTKYQMNGTELGWFLALVGVGLGIGLGILPTLVKDFRNKLVAMTGYSILTLAILIFAVANTTNPLWLFALVGPAMFGLAIANILPLFSDCVSEQRQGWIMGVTGSVVALTGGIDAAISGLLSNVDIRAPYVFAAVAVVLGLVFFSKVKMTAK